jgi:hypothetical protein
MAAKGQDAAVDGSEDKMGKLVKCKAVVKIKKGDLHAISLENAQELFDVLDVSERQELSTEDLRVLKTVPDLDLSDEDMDALIKDCDRDGNGKISLQFLYQALQQGSLVQRAVLAELGQGPKVFKKNECQREELLEFLEYENETSDALCSLPITLVAFFLFFILVQYHLEVSLAFKMQSAIYEETEGEGKPYVGTYVHDVPSFYYWFSSSYVGAQFKSSTEKLRQYPYPGRFAVYNQIIGGTQVVKTQSNEPQDCGEGAILGAIYDTLGPSRCHKSGDTNTTSEFLLYHETSDQIIEHIHHLDAINWIDHNTQQLDFTTLYYNAHLGTWTDCHLTFDFLPSGEVKILYGMETWIADPYKHKWLFAMDIIYILILARMFWQEAQEMLPRLLNGLDGFIQYWEFWNVVDWLNITFGTVFFVMWGLIVAKVTGPLQDAVSALPTKQLDDWVVSNQTYFTRDQLNDFIAYEDYTDKLSEAHAVAGELAGMHLNLRMITFFYSFTLMLKFFKAFRANPKLNVVIETITTAATDIIHFFLVFMTIFAVFSMMACIFFGPKILEFSSQTRGFFMSWRVLLGDWDVDEMNGVDYMFSNGWFLGFQVMVMMILLNMLLAIIMDTYSSVVGSAGSTPIWTQTREAIGTVRETRGHLDLLYIRCEMEDDDAPTHPGKTVSSKSLRKAFEGDKMTKHNADYLIRKTIAFLQAKEEECDLTMSDAVKLVGQTKTMVLKISEDTTNALNVLKSRERAPQDARHDAIMAGYDPDDPHSMASMKTAVTMGSSDAIKPVSGVAAGVPYNGPTGGFASPAPLTMQNMAGGMNHMGGMQNMNLPGQVPGQEDPFLAANAQNALSYGTLSNMGPLELSNSPYNTNQAFMSNTNQGGFAQNSNGFGVTGMGMGGPPGYPSPMDNSNVMGMGAPPSYPPPMGNMHNMHTMPMSNMGGMGMGMGGGQGVNQILDRMATQASQIHEMMDDQRNYIEQRHDWMETRMTQLDRRCQKVEVLSDRLYALLRSFDVDDLGNVPKEVTKALNLHFEKMEGGATPERGNTSHQELMALRDAASMSDAPLALADNDQFEAGELPSGVLPDLSNIVAVGEHNHSMGHQDSHKLEMQLKQICDQMEYVVSNAEATPSITRLLLRMDVNLRQLTGNGIQPENNPLLQQSIAAAAAAQAQQEAQQQAQRFRGKSFKGQLNAPGGNSTAVSNSRASSRIQSKSGATFVIDSSSRQHSKTDAGGASSTGSAE